MRPLPPWADGPFELLIHAEEHLHAGEDIDRRVALIGFDNAIEVAITTYLTLNPIQRGNRAYAKTDVEKWVANYHTKLDFLEIELSARRHEWEVEKSHIIWLHDQRNEQYHGGNKGVPEHKTLTLARQAAIWVFSVLFEVDNTNHRLDQATVLPGGPQREDNFDRAIDREFGMVDIGDQSFYSSEVLFSVDYAAYQDHGASLSQSPEEPEFEPGFEPK